ncbi:hypothetical protein AAAT52_14470 [Gemmiger formicilis]
MTFILARFPGIVKKNARGAGLQKINPRPEGWAGIYKKGGEEHMKM